MEADCEKGVFQYVMDGNYGDYPATVNIRENSIHTHCDCPYPDTGCKHTVAMLLDIKDKIGLWQSKTTAIPIEQHPDAAPYLTPEEIRAQAIEDRKKRAKNEEFTVEWGDTFKGEHLVTNQKGIQYALTLHDPETGTGHCSCPDFTTNRLGTCKHLIFLSRQIKKKRGYQTRIQTEQFPFIDIFWDSAEKTLFEKELEKYQTDDISFSNVVNTELYPYQKEGVLFSILKPSVLIGDEMGLGKTLLRKIVLKKKFMPVFN